MYPEADDIKHFYFFCIVDEVKVLCLHTNEPYNKLFENFMKSLHCKIRWVLPEEHINYSNQKYLLLVAVETRIPEDVQATLNYYKHQGKKLRVHILTFC